MLCPQQPPELGDLGAGHSGGSHNSWTSLFQGEADLALLGRDGRKDDPPALSGS